MNIHWLIFITLLATTQSEGEEDFEYQWNFPRDFIENPMLENSEEIPYEKSIPFATEDNNLNEADTREMTSYQNMTSTANEEGYPPIDNNKEVRFSNETSTGEAPSASSDENLSQQMFKGNSPTTAEDEKEIQYYSKLYGGEKFLPGDIPHQAKEELHVDNSQPTELQFQQIQQDERDLLAKNNSDGGAIEEKDNLAGSERQEQPMNLEENNPDEGDLLERQADGDRFINKNNNDAGELIKSVNSGEIAKSEQEIVSKQSTENASVRGNIAKTNSKKKQISRESKKERKQSDNKNKTTKTKQTQAFRKPKVQQNSNHVKVTKENVKNIPEDQHIYTQQQHPQQQIYNGYNQWPFYYNAYYPTATLQGPVVVGAITGEKNQEATKFRKPTLRSSKSLLRKAQSKISSQVQKIPDRVFVKSSGKTQQQKEPQAWMMNHNSLVAANQSSVTTKMAALPTKPLVKSIHQSAAGAAVGNVLSNHQGNKKEKITPSKESPKHEKKTSKHNAHTASKRKLKDCRNYRECLELSFAKYGFHVTSSVNSVEKLRDFFQIIFKRNYEKTLKREMGRFLNKLSDLRLNNWATIFDYRPRVADWLNVEFLRMPLGDETPANMKENVLFNRIVLLKGRIDDLTEDIRKKSVPDKGKSLERKRSFYERSLNNLRANHTILAQYRKEAPAIAVSGFDRSSQAWAECAPKGWESQNAPFSRVYQRMMDMNSYQCVLYAFMRCIKDSNKESQHGSFNRNKDGFASLIQLHYDYGAKQNRLISITDKNKYEYERITSAYCESSNNLRCLQEDGVTHEASFKFEGKHYCQNYFGCLATCGEKCFLKERNLLPDEFTRLKNWLSSPRDKKHDRAESELWTECCTNAQDCIPLQEAKRNRGKKIHKV